METFSYCKNLGIQFSQNYRQQVILVDTSSTSASHGGGISLVIIGVIVTMGTITILIWHNVFFGKKEQ